MELHNVDLNKIATFLTIAELGSVTAAATRLGLTRSAVSHSLRAIEKQLDVALFHRVGRGLVLTNEGTLLKHAAADVRSRMSVALEEVLGLGREVRGPVRLGLFLGFSRFRLAEAVDGFTRQHPNAEVRISFAPQAWLIAQLLAGKLDMTLSLRPTGQQATSIRSERLTVRPLGLGDRPVHKGARHGPSRTSAHCPTSTTTEAPRSSTAGRVTISVDASSRANESAPGSRARTSRSSSRCAGTSPPWSPPTSPSHFGEPDSSPSSLRPASPCRITCGSTTSAPQDKAAQRRNFVGCCDGA